MNYSFLQSCLVCLFFLCTCCGQKGGNTLLKEPNTVDAAILPDKIWLIFQDQKGHYWFGSDGDGIFHYDGKNIQQFTVENGLLSNQIRGFQDNGAGNVFIETRKGVNKFDGKTLSTVPVSLAKLNDWQLKPNDLWFNCNGDLNDIYRYDGQFLHELSFPRQDLKAAFGIDTSIRPYNPYGVYGITKDSYGNMWFGTVEAGAFRYDGTSFLWFSEKELSTLPDGRVPGVRSILEDKTGRFWLSNFIQNYTISQKNDGSQGYSVSTSGIAQDPHLQDILRYFNSGLRHSKTGDLWMTTYSQNLWQYDGKNLIKHNIKDGNTEALLVSVYEDREGRLWLGTDNAGVFRFDGERFVRFSP